MRFKTGLAVVAGALPASLVLIVVFLTIYAWPAIWFNGFQFVTSNTWNLGNLYGDPTMVSGTEIMPGAHYGILFLIVGTLLSTLIALVIAVPVGIGAAVFLAEAVPGRLRLGLSFFVELLAAVPSVVFGLWGYVVVIPALGHYVFPFLIGLLGFIPFFAGPPGSGYGLLTAGVVLALMIVPLIVATLRDALVSQPAASREAARALGATKFEVVWTVILPSQSRVLIGASILALGRALGETMAAFIVSQLDSALQDPTEMAVRSLAEIALILSLISLMINFLARLLLLFEKQGARRGAVI